MIYLKLFLNLEQIIFSTFEPKKREVKAMIAIDTSDGKKFTKLSFDELQKLHYDLQAVQNRLDSITK